VEPLHPELRRELLRVHPELTDLDLDEYERLTALRFTLNPSQSRAAIAELDRAREALVAKMPHFAAVQRAFSEERRRAALPDPDAPPRVRISIEPETEDTSAG
jgi:hypothetical protein